MEQTQKPYKLERKCDGCTMCCQGWLPGEVYGHTFYSGKPCHFVDCNGCSIYEDRPESPCKVYKCSWLIDHFFPQWFKPDQSKIICNWTEWEEGSYYLSVIECGEKIDAKYLNWLIMKQKEIGFNMRYVIDGGYTYMGDSEFIKYMNKEHSFRWSKLNEPRTN